MTAIMQQYSLGFYVCLFFFSLPFLVFPRGYVLGIDNGLSNHVFWCNIDQPTRLCVIKITYLAIQAEQECDGLRRKLKLVEDDLDRAEERLSEVLKQSNEYESTLEDRERWVSTSVGKSSYELLLLSVIVMNHACLLHTQWIEKK